MMSDDRSIYATSKEWSHAKEIMQQKMANGDTPPFKIPKDNQLDHSFIVAVDENNQPMLGVLARSKDQAEGILGFGSFGMCKLVIWEDGSKNAIKIENDINDQNEIGIMSKLGLIRALFRRSWDKRIAERQEKSPASARWIGNSAIRNKIYKIMPLIEGVDLSKFLSSVYLPKSLQAAQIIYTSIVEKLMAMHDKDILHNDLHPGNILVDANLNAYLIDNGKSVDLTNKPTTVKDNFNHLGQIARLAPELMAFRLKTLAERESDPGSVLNATDMPYSKASDVFALSFIFNTLFNRVQKDPIVQRLTQGMKETDPTARMSLIEILGMVKSSEFIESMIAYDEIIDIDEDEAEDSYEEPSSSTDNETSVTMDTSSNQTIKSQSTPTGYDETISLNESKTNKRPKT